MRYPALTGRQRWLLKIAVRPSKRDGDLITVTENRLAVEAPAESKVPSRPLRTSLL